MNKKNILISALGASPDIIEETIGLFNYDKKIDFYKGKESVAAMRDGLHHVDEVWLVATDQPNSVNNKGDHLNSTLENFECIKSKCNRYGALIRLFLLDNVPDITSESDARVFHDLLLRVVTFAHQSKGGGMLYLSLACGRKTMSADMQDAAYCFGCNQLLHVLGDRIENAQPLLMGEIIRNEAINHKEQTFEDCEIIRFSPATDYFDFIEQQKQQSQHFFTSYYLNEKETRSNFHVLYTLPPSKIEQLKSEHIGVNPDKQKQELEWLRQLPKSDLHCHLGGILNPKDLVNVAIKSSDVVEKFAEQNPDYAVWLKGVDYNACLDFITPEWKTKAKEISEKYNVPKCYVSIPILRQFKGREDELSKRWYGKYYSEPDFYEVGIEKYEQLGDLQGSSLLDTPSSIKQTMEILLSRCINENVKYLEIRCSPFNYVREGFFVDDVVWKICSMMDSVSDKLETSLIFIISRHRGDSTSDYVDLVKCLKNKRWFSKFFRGFDLAGNESIKTPEELRDSFMDIMKECYNITIHAGETEEVESIWQAVYHLNAERVGHGLKLLDNGELLTKFLERGIAVEMCPSSNFQIVGFRDNYLKGTANLPEYPLKAYLDKELKVSINTDDPGISLTDMTHELHKAARMTSGGLSKWEILQLICNGFRSAFYPYEQKKQLMRKVEREIGELINKGML